MAELTTINKVTIAIPTVNRVDYLKLAVASALAQTYPDLEVIVSNHASTDETAEYLKSITNPRLRVLEQPRIINMMENWNACLSAASGRYFLLLSDDDVLEPNAIAQMVRAFQTAECEGTSIGFVYCRCRTVDSCGGTVSNGLSAPSLESAHDLILGFLDGKRSLPPCGVLLRTADLLPGYDLRFPLAADTRQWMRAAAKHGAARFVNQTLAHYRIHQNNTTVRTPLDVWHKENLAMAEHAIGELVKAGFDAQEIAPVIATAVRRFNTRITSELINQSLRKKKLHALRAYSANARVFAWSYGLMILFKGLLSLMLPEPIRARLRRWRWPEPEGALA